MAHTHSHIRWKVTPKRQHTMRGIWMIEGLTCCSYVSIPAASTSAWTPPVRGAEPRAPLAEAGCPRLPGNSLSIYHGNFWRKRTINSSVRSKFQLKNILPSCCVRTRGKGTLGGVAGGNNPAQQDCTRNSLQMQGADKLARRLGSGPSLTLMEIAYACQA